MNIRTMSVIIIILAIIGLLGWLYQTNISTTVVRKPTATLAKVANQLASTTPTPTTKPQQMLNTEPTITSTIENSIELATPLSKQEQLLQEMQTENSQNTDSVDQCSKILESEPWCSVIKSVVPISKPEWKELFPNTEFYLVRYDLYGGEFEPQQRNRLIIEQNGQRYTITTFDRLLEVNDITSITDTNRELVAKSLALITLSDYLEDEIVFSNWEEGSWSSPIRLNFNYRISVWTKILGLDINYQFIFYKGELIGAMGEMLQQGKGDYKNVKTIPFPSQDSLRYWKNSYKNRSSVILSNFTKTI